MGGEAGAGGEGGTADEAEPRLDEAWRSVAQHRTPELAASQGQREVTPDSSIRIHFYLMLILKRTINAIF